MKTKEDYINILNSHASEIKSSLGVKSLSLFGSVARNEQQCYSDIDVFVDMQPNIVLIIKLKNFLEKKLGSPIDIIRNHNNLSPFIKQEIERDGITIF